MKLGGWSAALAVVLVGAGVWTGVSYLRLPRHEEGVTSRPIEVASGGYASSRSCEACHPAQYDSWHASYHRTMTQVVTPETVPAALDGASFHSAGTTWRVERRDDTFWVERSEPSAEPEPARPIVMSTGSHWQQAFWYSTGQDRMLEILPFHYLIGEDRWIPRQAAFLIPPGEDRFGTSWNTGCIHCHATRGRPRLEPGRVDTQVGELGIACEACHGPAAQHVRENRNPLRRYRLHLSGADDETLVNPAKLSKERASEVCGRCHSYGTAARKGSLAFDGYSYEPGQDLSESKRVYRRSQFPPVSASAERMFWSDGVVRGSGREFGALLESPCFQRGEMSCLSCHTMHKPADDPRPLSAWADDQLKHGMEGNAACLPCHPTVAARLEEHTHHPAQSSGSTCYNCHMSYTTYGLLKAIRSHVIDSPSVQLSLATGRPNACNQCHLDRSLDWSAGHLETWYDVPRPALSEEQRKVAASVLWLLRGDAAQRVLLAWSLGWEPAREASGEDWMAPYLAQLLEDPYPAVRYVAGRSLASLPSHAGFEFDFLGPPAELRASQRRALAAWPGARENPATLIGKDGGIDREIFTLLLAERNDRMVVVME